MADEQLVSPRMLSGNVALMSLVSTNDHSGLKKELSKPERLEWNKGDLVLDRLLRVDDAFAEKCATDMDASNEIKDAFTTLTNLANQANDADAAGKKTKEEKKMHEPLLKIFDFITKYRLKDLNEEEKPLRVFVDESGNLIAEDSVSPQFDTIRPDMTVVPVEYVTSAAKSQRAHKKVLNMDMFVELKASSAQGPKASGQGIPEILLQGARYARAFLAIRPFRVFSVGLLIFGDTFSAAIYDRGQIWFSSAQEFLEAGAGRNVFIRLVRSITHHLDNYALGLDPTVCRLPPTLLPKGILGKDGVALAPDDYAYVVLGKSPSGPSYITTGSALWNSLSLFGRGTQVWRVRQLEITTSPPEKIDDCRKWLLDAFKAGGSTVKLTKFFRILKTAWRRQDRDAESLIYQSLKVMKPPPEIAVFHAGGDVELEPGKKVTASMLREGKQGVKSTTNPMQHRVVLNSYGKLLWECDSELELVQGLIAIVSGKSNIALPS